MMKHLKTQNRSYVLLCIGVSSFQADCWYGVLKETYSETPLNQTLFKPDIIHRIMFRFLTFDIKQIPENKNKTFIWLYRLVSL